MKQNMRAATLKKIVFWCVLCGGVVAGTTALVLIYFIFTLSLPNLTDPSSRPITQSTKIYDKTGEILLYDIHGEEKRTIVDFDKIPKHVKDATIALEDDQFYKHRGVRPVAIIRAFITNILNGSIQQGGSTITQQLVKKIFLNDKQTITRKLKELVLALKVERQYTKDEILGLYLNQISYGSSAYGIEAAAQTFFKKHVGELTLKESAYLVSLPNAPSYLSPCGKHRDKLDERASFALIRMRDLGYISNEEYKQGAQENIQFQDSCYQGIIAPHFVIEVRELLNEKFGEDEIEKGGLKVITTLDVPLQKKAEEAVQKYAETNKSSFGAHNESVIAIDPKTGGILALVGSKNYFGDTEPENCSSGNTCFFDPQVDITTHYRQPGSAFKPFVYATAFKKGFTPETMLFDVFTEFAPACPADASNSSDACYHPHNYDNKFRGPVSMRDALAQSLNVPAVKTLYLAGMKETLATAEDVGITSLNDPNRLGLTLVLGGGEVSLRELVSAYGVFANDGFRNPYSYISRIEDGSGKTIFVQEKKTSQALDQNIARAINSILSDNRARTPAFGDNSALHFSGKSIAVKTGTTNDYRDAWVVGYTPNIVIGAWAGNNNNAPMEKKVAGFIIAPLWHEIMDWATSQSASEEFIDYSPFPTTKPVLRGEWRGGKEFIIDKISKKLATEYTPKDLQEKKVVQSVHTILHWINKNDFLQSSGNINDPQYQNWESAVRRWAESQGLHDQDDSIIPKDFDNIHTADTVPRVVSVQIEPEKSFYLLNDLIVVRPTIESKFGIAQVDYFINGEYKETKKIPPFSFSFSVDQVDTDGDTITVSLKVYDAIGNTVEYSRELSISL
jgi:penicillin-binding protein 1C